MASIRDRSVWQFTATIVLLCTFGSVSDARDSAEVVAVGKCLWQMGSCAGWDWTYRPPLPPMLAALVPLKGSAGVVLVSLLATAAWVFPVRRLLRGEGAGWAFVLCIVATPGIRTAAMVGDPRSLGTLALLASAAAVVEKRWFLGGLFAGGAALCRVEVLVATALVVVMAAGAAGAVGVPAERPAGLAAGRAAGSVAGVGAAAVPGRARAITAGRAALLAAAGGTLALAPWITAISLKLGRVTLVSRAWEGAAAGWSETLTLPLVHLWVGPSAWDGPLREALGSAPPSASILDISTILPALWDAAALALPLWLGTIAVAGLFIVVATRRSAGPVVVRQSASGGAGPSPSGAVWPVATALLLLAPPTLLSLATRPGRESPEASFIPLLVLCAVVADLGLGLVQTREMARKRAKRSVLVPLVVGIWALWAVSGLLSGQSLPPRERTAASVALAARLANDAPKTQVGAVFATSHILREAGREWIPLYGRATPNEIILAQGDDPWAVLGLLVPPTAKVQVTERFGGEGWAVLLSVQPDPATLE